MSSRFAVICGLALSFLTLSLWVGQRPMPPSPELSPSPESRREASLQAPAPTVELRLAPAELGRGDTLSAALDRLEIPAELKPRIIADLGDALDLSRLPASAGLVAAWRADGELRSLALRTEPDRFVRWTAGGEIQIEELPVEREIRRGSGEVLQSVRQALDEFPRADELTVAFADIFQWDIDLLVEPRRGDRVSVVYEIERLGAVPVDLPSLGKAARESGSMLGLGRVLAASYDGRLAQSTAYFIEHQDGGGGYFDADGGPLRKTFLKSPLSYRRISSGFSRARRHPVTRKVVPHHGVDFAAAAGTPVVAAADGRVIRAGWDGALGRAVRIKHGSEYTTVYGHLQGFARGIRSGSEVRQNEVIGYVGSTGRATGPHLHYTLIERGRPIDPLRFKNPPASPLAAERLPDLRRAMLEWAPLLEDRPVLAGWNSRPLRRGV